MHHGNNIWKVVAALETLCEFSFNWRRPPATLPEDALGFFAMRDSVHIFDSFDPFQLAKRIGGSVSEIYTEHSLMKTEYAADQVISLQKFPRLKRVCFKIKEGPTQFCQEP